MIKLGDYTILYLLIVHNYTYYTDDKIMATDVRISQFQTMGRAAECCGSQVATRWW